MNDQVDGVGQPGGAAHDIVVVAGAFQEVAGTVAAAYVVVAADIDPGASFVGVAVDIAFGQDAVDIAFEEELVDTEVGAAETVVAGIVVVVLQMEAVLLGDRPVDLVGSRHEPSM